MIADILANAGGVMVSNFERVQNLQRFRWTEREEVMRLETMLEGTLKRLMWFAKTNKVPNPVAARALAIKTVADLKDQRGMFP